jgi:hypothetical protein
VRRIAVQLKRFGTTVGTAVGSGVGVAVGKGVSVAVGKLVGVLLGVAVASSVGSAGTELARVVIGRLECRSSTRIVARTPTRRKILGSGRDFTEQKYRPRCFPYIREYP